MAENLQKDVLINIKTDTSESSSGLDTLKQKIEDAKGSAVELGKVDYGEMSVKDLRLELDKTEQSMKQLELSGQGTEKSFKVLESRVDDITKALNNFKNTGTNGFETLTGSLQGLVGVAGTVEGAMGALGIQTEDFEEYLMKMQGLSALRGGLEDLKDGMDKTGVSTKLLTGVQTAYTFVTNGSTVAIKVFRAALVSLGIGALMIAVGLLVENWDKLVNVISRCVAPLTDFMGLTSESSREANKLSESLSDVNKELDNQMKLFNALNRDKKTQLENEIRVLNRQITTLNNIRDLRGQLSKEEQDQLNELTIKRLDAYDTYNSLLIKEKEDKKRTEEAKREEESKTLAAQKANQEISKKNAEKVLQNNITLSRDAAIAIGKAEVTGKIVSRGVGLTVGETFVDSVSEGIGASSIKDDDIRKALGSAEDFRFFKEVESTIRNFGASINGTLDDQKANIDAKINSIAHILLQRGFTPSDIQKAKVSMKNALQDAFDEKVVDEAMKSFGFKLRNTLIDSSGMSYNQVSEAIRSSLQQLEYYKEEALTTVKGNAEAEYSILESYNKRKAELYKYDSQNKKDATLETADAVANAGQKGLELSDAIFGENKATAIGSALINTALGVTNALMTGGPVVKWIDAAAVAASGAAAVIKIAKTTKSNASAGSTSNIAKAPSFNTTILNREAPTDLNSLGTNNTDIPETPIRAYIVDRDLENTKNKNELNEKLSTF